MDRIKKDLFNNLTKHLNLSINYNPPMGSRYSKPNLIEEIGIEILDMRKRLSYNDNWRHECQNKQRK